MLKFTLKLIQLGRRNYVLLPKLCKSQVEALAERLSDRGFIVEKSATLVARGRGTAVHVNPSGFCRSSVDQNDAIAPAIPSLLRTPKERVSLDVLSSRYFKLDKVGGSLAVRFSARIESTSLWKALRANGECGLTPDEQTVAQCLVGTLSGMIRLITDFPAERSRIKIIGNRQY